MTDVLPHYFVIITLVGKPYQQTNNHVIVLCIGEWNTISEGTFYLKAANSIVNALIENRVGGLGFGYAFLIGKHFFVFSISHGIKCAGIIAAVANNSFCGVGIAYSARIGGIVWSPLRGEI